MHDGFQRFQKLRKTLITQPGHGRIWSALSRPFFCCSWPPVCRGNGGPFWWCSPCACKWSAGAQWSLCCPVADGSASRFLQIALARCGSMMLMSQWICSQKRQHMPDPLTNRIRYAVMKVYMQYFTSNKKSINQGFTTFSCLWP